LNFLAHYFTVRDQVSDYIKTGTVLPDILRQVNARIRIIRYVPHTKYSDKGLRQITLGFEYHLEGDRLFHDSSQFHSYHELTKTKLKQYKLNKENARNYLTAHILVELLLDRLLLKNVKNIGEDFYSTLENVDLAYFSALFEKDRHYQHTRFTDHFLSFISYRYALHYIHDEAITFALNRICSRLGSEVILKTEFNVFYECIHEIETLIQTDFLPFLEQLKKQIVQPR
jgi:hypothetical protein